jgi:hypothetical protein
LRQSIRRYAFRNEKGVQKEDMNVEIFSTWLRNQGYRIYRTESSYWYNAGPNVLQAFPYNWLIQPSVTELRKLILMHNILAIRYSTPLDSPEGMVSYHVILKSPYQLDMLRSQTRNGIRSGLKHCQVERIPLKRLAEEGWNLQQDTLERQDRLKSMNREDWQRICSAADGLPSFEAWGALVEGELAAALLTCRIDDTCLVPYALSLRKYLNMHVNNALFYRASCDMLAREGVNGIFFSLHSLDAPESVNEFKFRMGFTARPVLQRVVFHPLLKPFANELTHRWLLRQLQMDPSKQMLAKFEGLLRFYRRGKYPIHVQPWPDCVSSARDDFLRENS